MWRGERPEIRLRHKNGSVRADLRQLSRRKAQVKTSQTNKRREAARRLQRGGAQVGVAKTTRCRTRPSHGAVQISVTKQVGLVAARSMRNVCFNRWRLALGGAASGLCILPILRAERRELSALPGKNVVVTGSGAHLISLTAAIQERLSALCDGGLFVEMPANASAGRRGDRRTRCCRSSGRLSWLARHVGTGRADRCQSGKWRRSWDGENCGFDY